MCIHAQGGTLIFLYISRLRPFFSFKALNFNIFSDFQKNEYFWGMMILWIFLGSSENWTSLRGHFFVFYGLFLR